MAIGTPVAILQATSTTNGSSKTFSFTTGASVGDTVILQVGVGSTTAVSLVSVSDTQGHTWSVDLDPTQVTSTGTTFVVRTRVTSTIAIGNTVTVTIDANKSRWQAAAIKVSGLASSSVLDVTAVQTGSDANPSSGATATPTAQAEELVVGAFFSGIRTFTAGSGYTAIAEAATAAGTSDRQIDLEYKITSATGQQTATATYDTSSTFIAAVLCYKGAATNATVSASTVAATASVGSPTLHTGVRVAAAVVAAVATVAAPALSTGSTVQQPTVAATASVSSPSVQAGSPTGGMLIKIQDWTVKSSGTAQVSSMASTAFGSTPTSGNTLFLAVVSENTVSTPAGWTLANESIGQAAGYLFYKTAGGAEPTSVTVTATAPSAMTISTAEYAGVSSLNTTSVSKGVSATRFTGSATSTWPATFDIAVFGTIGTAPTGHSNPTNGFTEERDFTTSRTTGNNIAMAVDTRRDTSSGTINSQVTSEGTITAGVTVLGVFALDLNNAQPMPSTVSAPASVDAVSGLPVSITVTPATVAATASVDAPTVFIPALTQVNVSTVQATASVMDIVQVTTHSTVTPTRVLATATVPAPTSVGDSTPLTTVQPATVSAVASVGSPSVTQGSSVTVSVSTVQATASVPAPTIVTGTSVSVTVATVGAVSATGTVGTPTIVLAGSVSLPASTVHATASVPNVTIAVGTDERTMRFTPPTYEQVVIMSGALRHTMNVGISVLKEDGAYRMVRTPTSEEVDAADIAYIGGHVYDVSLVEAAALTAAGYGDFLTMTGYGRGTYGSGAYGV